MDEYKQVCALYNKLCKERNCSTLWAANIVDASQGITKKIVWQNFYAYMANTNHIYSDKWLDSLGEQVEKGLKLNEEGIKFKTKTVQNGTVTYIQMTPEILLSSINKDNGKQVADLPERLPEETPGNEPEASNEISLG